MFNRKKERNSQANLYEYAFTPVPSGKQKNTYGIFVVLAGYVIALSGLVTGANIGYAMPFWHAVTASLIGNCILLFIGINMGIVAYKRGWSTTFLSRRAFGKRASSLFSVCIILLSINWIGVNGDSFAHMIISVFPNWPIPIPITAVLIIVLWAASASYGWAGLEALSRIMVPLGISLLIICMFFVIQRTDNFSFVSTHAPLTNLSFTTAVAAVTGNFIFGCVSAPDICRFAFSRKSVIIAIIPAYSIGLFLLNVCGILVGQAGQHGDFNTAVARLGLSLPFLLCTIPFLWTTQDNNLYGGSLATQNLFQGTSIEGNLSHKTVVLIISCFASAFASIGAYNYLFNIITFISILIPPIPGIILGEEYFVRKGKEYKDVNWLAIIAWALGAGSGALALEQNLIAPLAAIGVSFFSYIILSKIFDNQ